MAYDNIDNPFMKNNINSSIKYILVQMNFIKRLINEEENYLNTSEY